MTTKSDISLSPAEVNHTITSVAQPCCAFARSRFARWKLKYWIFFYGVVPAILTGIFLLPPNIKNDHFIFHFGCSDSVSIYLNAFVHSALDHFYSNLVLYLISIAVILIFCCHPRILWQSSFFIFLALPLIVSWVTDMEFGAGNLQGFSGIVFAYFGFMLWCLVKFVVVEYEPSKLKHKQKWEFSMWAYTVIGFVFFLYMVIIGLYIGIIPYSEHVTLNNPGHLTGFIFGLLVPSLLDLDFRPGPNITGNKKLGNLIINIWFLIAVVWLWILYFLIFLG